MAYLQVIIDEPCSHEPATSCAATDVMVSTDPIRTQIRSGWERTSSFYANDYPQVFQRFAVRLIELINLSPGQQILDVGTGTGIVALEAARRVGASGKVTAIDFAGGMLARARAACKSSRPEVLLARMDAERLGFPDDSFDRVTCAFSLFQFVDMTAALEGMLRALKPGGMLGLSNWGTGFFTPVAAMQRDLFRQFHIRPLLANPLTFNLEGMQALLEAAGFMSIQIICEHVPLWFESPEGVWEWNLAMGPFTAMLESQLSSDERQELESRYIEMLEPLMTSGGVACTFHPLYALASK